MNAPLLQADNLVREYTLPREKLTEPPPKVHASASTAMTIPPRTPTASTSRLFVM